MPVQKAAIAVHVQPNARKNEITGYAAEVLRVKIVAPPVKGKANAELVDFLSQALSIRRGDVVIVRGETSRDKLVEINGLTRQMVLDMLLPQGKLL
jgi:uncharacterized protein (TIGR00251 family)